MKAMKKNDLGVSPVIAVILMVAITVVLAGVVFLWAQSFTEDATGGVDTITASAVFEYDSTAAVGSEYSLLLTPTNGEIDWAIFNLIFEGGNTIYTVSAEPATTTTIGLTASFTITTTGTFTVGEEFSFSLVNIEDDSTALTKTVILKNA